MITGKKLHLIERFTFNISLYGESFSYMKRKKEKSISFFYKKMKHILE